LDKWCAEYLTTGAVARYCGVSSVTILRWIRKGHLPAFRLPEGHYRISRDDLSKFLRKYDIPIRRKMAEKEE